MKNRWLPVALSTAAAVISAAQLSGASAMVFPDVDWAEASPESQGVNTANLDKAMRYLGSVLSDGQDLSQALVVRNGYLIWKGTDIGLLELHQLRVVQAEEFLSLSRITGLRPFDRFSELPDNSLGGYLREKRPRLEKLYPGGENDLAMAIYFLHPELVRNTRRVCLDGWAKDDKGDEMPVLRNAAGGNLLFIIEADGDAGGREWLSAMTQPFSKAAKQ